MNQERKSLAFGGFFGGTMAGLLWLAISLQYGLGLWAIVPVSLIGGCFGWLACDFADAKRSVKIAWKQVVGWKPDEESWRDRRCQFLGMFAVCSGLYFWLGVVLWESFVDSITVGLSAGLFFGLVMLLACAKDPRNSKEENKFFKTLLIHWNVVTIPLSILWYAGKGIVWVLMRVPFAAKTAGKFLWRAFVLAHSSKRRVCFIGTTFGAGAGLFVAFVNGNNLVLGVVLAGIFGELFSLVWHEVVAVRWLGIKPA